jgi:myo-inositol-1(or 4)-monophosphatase
LRTGQTQLSSTVEILERIKEALEAAVRALSPFVSGNVMAEQKSRDRGPVTEADRAVNRVLQEKLVRDGEGWLSEETIDDPGRLGKHRVWIVDPLDGTKEFIAGIPEWCISIAMVEDGRAIAGGVCNPATKETFLGSRETGITYNGCPAQASRKNTLEGAMVLASRSEVGRGDWACFQDSSFIFRPMGSVAYKLALTASGLADATWTLSPKNEWDIAAGVALVEAAGGVVQFLPDSRPAFNNKSTLLPGLFACGPLLTSPISTLLRPYVKSFAERSDTPRKSASGRADRRV